MENFNFIMNGTTENFFFFFSLLTVLAALGVILSFNTVTAVLCLILVFIFTACIFILFNAEFLALTILIVYVGAIAVLFLFVVMMLELKSFKTRKVPKLTLINFLSFVFSLAFPFVFYFFFKFFCTSLYGMLAFLNNATTNKKNFNVDSKHLDNTFMTTYKQLNVLSTTNESTTAPGIDLAAIKVPNFIQNNIEPNSQINNLGSCLYTDFGIYLIVAGILLLVAMIGTIALTTKFSELVRRQRSAEQIASKSLKKVFIFY